MGRQLLFFFFFFRLHKGGGRYGERGSAAGTETGRAGKRHQGVFVSYFFFSVPVRDYRVLSKMGVRSLVVIMVCWVFDEHRALRRAHEVVPFPSLAFFFLFLACFDRFFYLGEKKLPDILLVLAAVFFWALLVSWAHPVPLPARVRLFFCPPSPAPSSPPS